MAEHLHFTRAAAALGVTVSAASMQIQSLEQYLGVPLFHRTGRLVELSADGRELLPKIREGLAALQNALEGARAAKGHGPLRITTLGSFLTQWLMPRLARFEALHPGVELHIETSPELIDFRRSEVHAAVRLGGGAWPELVSDKLLDEWFVPVCEPSMLARHGPVNDQNDLKRYRLLHSSSEPWSSWLIDEPLETTSGISIDDSAAIARAAEAGQGLALARWSLVADDVRRGLLAVAGRRFIPHVGAYYFVCPPRHLQLPKVAAFHAWLKAEAAAQPAPVAAGAAPVPRTGA